MKENINILVLNDISRSILRYLQKSLASAFKKNIIVSKHVIVPTSFYNIEKNQYDGRKLLAFLTENLTLKEAKDINLAIFNRDLFTGNLDYVFSLSTPFPRICLISVIRLHPHFGKAYFQDGLKKRKMGRFPLSIRKLTNIEKKLYYERVMKEALHGIGHTMGLVHCTNDQCIMFPSNLLENIDKKMLEFCRSCSKVLPD
jgi:archaemetzincin